MKDRAMKASDVVLQLFMKSTMSMMECTEIVSHGLALGLTADDMISFGVSLGIAIDGFAKGIPMKTLKEAHEKGVLSKLTAIY